MSRSVALCGARCDRCRYCRGFQGNGRRVRGGERTNMRSSSFHEAFARENMVTDDPPIVAVNAIAAIRITSDASRPVAIREAILF